MNSIKVFYILIVFAGLVMTACEEKGDCGFGENNDAYFLFGHFYGECGGEGCVEIYKLEDGKLYEDTNDTYPNDVTTYEGEWVQLPDAKCQAVRDIEGEVPTELFSEPGRILGIPDGGDWGGIILQIHDLSLSDPSRTGTWLLDQNENNMDSVFNAFVDKVNEKIQLINQ